MYSIQLSFSLGVFCFFFFPSGYLQPFATMALKLNARIADLLCEVINQEVI